MARILVQTNDYRTVLDESDVQLADINDEQVAGGLLDRVGRAVHDAECGRARPRRPVRRLAAIVPVSDYRVVRG